MDAIAAPTVEEMGNPVRRPRFRVVILRALWYVAAVLAVQALWFSLPLGYQRLSTVCMEGPCSVDQLTPAGLEALQAMGLSPQFYAVYETGLYILAALIFGGVSIIIFVARPHEPMALFAAILLMLFGVFVPENVDSLENLHPTAPFFLNLMRSICWISLAWLFYLFPDGKFTPGWTRWAAYLWLVLQAVPIILGPGALLWGDVAALIEMLIYLGLFGVCIVAQVLRYRRTKSETQRLQSKWLLFGFTQAMVVVIVTVESLPFFFPALDVPGTRLDLIVSAVQVVSLSVIPVAIGFAIMRYRLWDVDLVINRTLVYVPLTSIVAVLYSTTMSLSQRLLAGVSGEQSQAVAVVTTIVLTTTFTPIRTRIQHFVDAHFKEQPDRLKRLRQLEEQVRFVLDTLDRQEVGKRLVDNAVFALNVQGGALYLDRNGNRELVYVSPGWNAEDEQVSISLDLDDETLGLLLLGLHKNGVAPDEKRLAEVGRTATRVAEGICRTPLP